MQTLYGFTKMSPTEFTFWLSKQTVSRKITKIQLHHTWSPSYAQFNGNNHFNIQSGMKSYHMSVGYSNIAQNFTIFPDGSILTGRSMNSSPAGIVGCNTNGICIENVGNFDKGYDVMTSNQKNAIIQVTAALLKKFSLSAETGVTYHGWWTAGGTYLGDYISGKSCKTCPGTNFFGGNTMASYKKNLMPLIKQAMNGTFEEEEQLAKKTIQVYDNQTKKNVSVTAVELDNENYIRLRDMEKFGCAVDYDAVKKLPSIDVARPMKELPVEVDGKRYTIKAVNQNDTNFIGIRDIFEQLGYKVDWDESTGAVIIGE